MFIIVALDNFQLNARYFLCPIDEFAAVSAIGPNERERRMRDLDTIKQQLCPVTILDICLMNNRLYDETERINEYVSFTTFNFLASVIA